MLFVVSLRLLKPRFSVEIEPQFFRFREESRFCAAFGLLISKR